MLDSSTGKISLTEEISLTETELPKNGIELIVEPRKKENWEDFLRYCGPNAIALDGRVIGPVQRDYLLPAMNFNHHEGVDRMTTLATCAQVFMAIRTGGLDGFKKFFHIFVEDCDEDVSTAFALLRLFCKDPELLKNWRVSQLVDIENKLDMSAGMYPVSHDYDLETLAKIRWVYAPYREARRAGKIATMGADEMKKIIFEIGNRIELFIKEEAESIPLDGCYEDLGGGKAWKLIKEVGVDARAQVVSEGVKALVSVEEVCPSDNQEKRYKYTLARMSPGVPFPIPELYDLLNRFEGVSPDSTDRWGGSDLSGGSPKGKYSSIEPKKLEEIINNFLSGKN